MSLENESGRPRRLRRVRTNIRPSVYSHEISRTQLYEQWKRGIGPRFYWQGPHRRITEEAAAEYRAEREAASQES